MKPEKYRLKKFYEAKLEILSKTIEVNYREIEAWKKKGKSLRKKLIEKAYNYFLAEKQKIDPNYKKEQVLKEEFVPKASTKLTIDELTREGKIYLERLKNSFPIYAKKEEIVENLKKKKIIIIEGKPGCGKSTQIPQYILEILE